MDWVINTNNMEVYMLLVFFIYFLRRIKYEKEQSETVYEHDDIMFIHINHAINCVYRKISEVDKTMHESLILNVMEKLLYGDIQILEILRSQYRDSKKINVECSNVGFFVNFEVDSNKIDVDGIATDFNIGDLYGTVDGIQGAVGFILFVIDGKLSMLEGYTNAIDVWPADEDIYLIYDIGFDRNIEVLEKQWKIK